MSHLFTIIRSYHTKTVKGTPYYKWVVVIPPDIVKKLEWDKEWEKAQKSKKQIELEARARQGKLVIEKK